MRKFVNRMFDLLCVSSPLQRPPTLSSSVYLSRVKTTHFANLTGKQSSKNMNEFVFDEPRWRIWPCQVSSEIRTSYKVEPHTQHHPACEATQTPLRVLLPVRDKDFHQEHCKHTDKQYSFIYFPLLIGSSVQTKWYYSWQIASLPITFVYKNFLRRWIQFQCNI